MEYKKHYTDEELNELVSWFKEHMDELPESVSWSSGIVVKNLKHTARLYFDIVSEHKDNPTYSAQILHLFKMRDAALKVMNGNAETENQ